MKIIYIPVVIPVNLRTFVALQLCLLATILLTAGVSTHSWHTLSLKIRSEYSNVSRVSKVVAYQGLQYIDVYVCSKSSHFHGDFCDPHHVIFTQCDDTSDSWCVGRVGFLMAFWCGIVALVLSLVSIGIALVREVRHGFVAAAAAAFGVVGVAAYYGGYRASVSGGLRESLYYAADVSYTTGVMDESWGGSFYAYFAGVVCVVSAAIISLSLHCCAAYGRDNRAFTDAPTIQTVHMDTTSTTTIATIAPQPGFVQLSTHAGGCAYDDDDDADGLITVMPDSAPMRRQDTLPPGLGQSDVNRGNSQSEAEIIRRREEDRHAYDNVVELEVSPSRGTAARSVADQTTVTTAAVPQGSEAAKPAECEMEDFPT